MYSIVLPIKLRYNDFILFSSIGIPSYKKFLDKTGLLEFIIIIPQNEIKYLDFLKNVNLPFVIYPEEMFEKPEKKPKRLGWYTQQLIKLNSAKIVKTDYYLILDADHYLTRPFSVNDIFHTENNITKIKYHSEPWQTLNNEDYSTNSQWWTASCGILNYDETNLHDKTDLMGVTPQIFHTKIMLNLLTFLEHKYGDSWQDIITNKKFTECSIYWIYVLQNDYQNLYTNQGTRFWCSDRSCNILGYEYNPVVVYKSFTDNPCYFSVIQSWIPQDLSPYVKMAQQFLN